MCGELVRRYVFARDDLKISFYRGTAIAVPYGGAEISFDALRAPEQGALAISRGI